MWNIEEEECCLFDHLGSGGYIKTQYKSLTCRPPKYIQFSYRPYDLPEE